MPLSDDQRAMLRLLAQREQGYEDIAALMGLSVDDVRARVGEALAQLEEEGVAPPPLPPEPPPAEKPAPPPPPPPPKPAPVRVAREAAKHSARPRPKLSLPADRAPRAAIAAGVAVVILVVVVLIVSGGGGGSSDSTPVASTTPTAPSGSESSGEAAALKEVEANPKLTKAILTPIAGGEGSGIAIFGKVKKEVVIQLQAKGLAPSPKDSSYTVWLYKSPKLALRVGSVTVTKSGGISAQFPIPTELLAYVASGAFDQVDVSLTSNAAYEAAVAKAKKEKTLPAYTGTDVLRGKITGPAIK